jgi:small subunit ribosomal protein S19e
MTAITEVDAQKFIALLSERLRDVEQIQPPEWAAFAKTGAHKERPPTQENWWWVRSASLLRTIALNPQLGLSKFRKRYGGRKNRGHKPEHKVRASGAVIRKALQQLEAAGFVTTEKGKGRKLTSKGQSFLSSVAKDVK